MYLIRHELPKEAVAVFRWTLVAIKTAGAPCTGATYVAFDTEIEAAAFAGTLNAAFCYSVVRSDQIGLSTYVQPDSCMIVFASAGDLKTRRELGDLSQGRFFKLESPRGVASFARRVKNWMAARMNRGIGGQRES